MTVELLHNTTLRKCRVCGITAKNDNELHLFIKGTKNKYGKQLICKGCHNNLQDKEKNKDRTNKLRKQNKQQGLEFVKEYYGFPFECNKCGYTSELFAPFDLHHRNPDDKEGTPSQLFKQSFDRFKKEVEKCDLVCANCHRIEHYNKKQGDNYEN